MKKVLLTLWFICQLVYAQVPAFSWAIGNWGNAGNDFGLSTTTDAQGNVYSTGAFKGTVDFDPGTPFLGIASAGLNDLYVQKLSPTGSLIWVIKVGSTGEEIGRGIAIDPDGNILITGNFTSTTTDFDPGVGITNLTCNGNSDIFILKLSPTGTLIWAKNIGSSSEEMGYSICSDQSSNVIVGGHFNGTVDFDPGAGTTSLTALVGYPDVYVLKLDANGNFNWVDQLSGTGPEFVFAIKADIQDNIGVVGYFEGSLDIDPGTIVNAVSGIGYDGFIVKLNNNGIFLWGQDMGGSGNDVYSDIQFDQNSNIIATGYFQGGADFDPGGGIANPFANASGNDAFVQKLDSADNLIWVKSFGSFGVNESGYGVDIDENNNIITTGYYNGTVDFDPGGGTSNFTSAGLVDAYIQKLDINGNFLWAKSFGGAADDIPRGISLDPFGNIAVSGYYNGTADFDPSASTFNLTSGGGSDIFTIRFQCLSTSSSVNISSCGNYTSPSGNHIWTTNGIYQDTIANNGGCDSIMNINLTILSPTANSITETACNLYISPSGSHTWNTSGIYLDTIANHVGCDSVITINLNVTTIDTSITISNGVFTVAQSGGTYQWGDCIAQIAVPGETNQSFTPLINGTYVVIVNLNGCADTSACYAINDVGIENPSNITLGIFPNPTDDLLNISANYNISELTIMDISGKILMNVPSIEKSMYSINVANLSKGVYIISIKSEGEWVTKRFIKN